MLWSELRGGSADLAGTPVQTGRAVAESHREDAVGRETPLQAGLGKIAEMLQVNNLRYASTPF